MKILLFGITKDIVGASSLIIEEDKPSTIKDLKLLLSKRFPDFDSLSSLAVAVNSNYAEDTVVLNESDEIAIIPPVSGG